MQRLFIWFCALYFYHTTFGYELENLVSELGSCDDAKWTPPVEGQYNITPHIATDKLNVHLIPHTHDDAGWLITVDQYYMQEVQNILDNVISELRKNPHRTFMYVEQAFFQRWWHEQTHEIKQEVKRLVKKGQLDLTCNGGWVMHDEATTHFTAMLDQTSLGHHFLKKEFGVTPKIGWQIDPFGHSATQAAILSAGIGFKALYFARIDYQDYAKRLQEKNLEYIWRPSKSLGKNAQVFTGVMQNHYGPPQNYDFSHDTPIQDDRELHDYNVCDRVEPFIRECLNRAAATRGNHIYIPMGTDFTYQNAVKWFKNMDKLIHYTNQDGRVNVLYSNMSYYTDLKLQENITWSVKTDDLFPYGDQEHAYWTGYFTSRPAIKKFVRTSNILLHQLKQIEALYSHKSEHNANLRDLMRSVALVQHHDGVSGTEKQAVAFDYALRLNDGIIAAQKGLNSLFGISNESSSFEFCLLANTSVCSVSQHNKSFEMFAYNPLPYKQMSTFSVPVSVSSAKVKDASAGTDIASHVIESNPVFPEKTDYGKYTLLFDAELPPMSHRQFQISETSPWETPNTLYVDEDVNQPITMENSHVKVLIDPTSASIVSVTNKEKNLTVPLSSSIRYYKEYQGSGQDGGAYIMRPVSNESFPALEKGYPKVLHNYTSDSSHQEVSFEVSSSAAISYKLNSHSRFVEMEWTVGPIDIADNAGKEFFVNLCSQGSIKSDKKWYTDSNGLEFIERVRNYRETWDLKLHDSQETVAANYVPMTTGAYIKDNKYQLNVVTDRSQGVSSLIDGQLEVLVHRRLLKDDGRGVGESLNEQEQYWSADSKKVVTKGLKVRGSLFISLEDVANGMKSIRREMQKKFFSPLVAFKPSSTEDSEPSAIDQHITFGKIPENIGVINVEKSRHKCIKVQLLHQYAIDEDTELSQPVEVDFEQMFNASGNLLSSVEELSMTGTEKLSEQEKEVLEWQTVKSEANAFPSSPVVNFNTTMNPMEIRSFEICFHGPRSGVFLSHNQNQRSYEVDEAMAVE